MIIYLFVGGTMDWKKLSNEEFINFIEDTITNKSSDILEKLANDEELMNHLRDIKSNNIYSGNDKAYITRFTRLLKSFKKTIKLKHILDDPNMYTMEDRKDFFDAIYGTELQGVSLYGDEFRAKVSDFKSNYYLRILDDNVEYAKLRDNLKKILNYYKSNNDLNDLCYYIYSELEITIFSFRNYLQIFFKYYFKSFNGECKERVYEDFEYKDLTRLKEIEKYYIYDFYRTFFNKYEGYDTYQDNNTLLELYKQIHILEEKYNYEYTYIVNELVHNYNIKLSDITKDLDELNTLYLSKYCHGYKDNIPYFKNVYSFYKVQTTYSNLASKHLWLTNIIVGNSSNRDEIINISYFLLAFNGYNPSFNKNRFNGKINLYKDIDGRNKIIKYIKDYYKYYQEYTSVQKEKLKREELEQKREQELPNVNKYEKIVLDYVNSNSNNINLYCKSINISEDEFKYMLNILELFEKPVFNIYKEYIQAKQRERYAVIISKLNKMLNNLVESNGNYSMLDYYRDTNIDLKRAFKILRRTITPEQRRFFAPFYKKYESDKELVSQQKRYFIDEYKISYPLEKDENGNITKFYSTTKEDRQQVLLILAQRKIPITKATTSLMLKEYFEENILPVHISKQKKID